jgi:glutamate 5-kinase
MMTDVDAVFDKPPTEAGAQRIAVFDRKQQVAIGAISAGGRGGMASKILAAQTAAAGGVHAVVANGHDLANITRVFEGTDVGTLFPGNKTRPSKLQHWLAHAAKSTNLKGKVSVSKSAAARMTNKCTTTEAPPLTMADILSTHGSFDSNTAIEITDDEGAPIGRGLIQLASSDLEQRPRNMQDMNVFLPKDMVFMPQAN